MDGGDSFTILFSGGGTGGHLMPGLSVAEEIRRSHAGARSVFVGTSRGLERRLVERRGFEFSAVPSAALSGPALGAPRRMARLAGGLVSSRRLIRQLRPEVVVSLGGYAAVGPALAGVMANVPLAVMEQNVLPGKANRLLSWWAREVYVPWAGMAQRFAYPERVHVTGNPVRGDFFAFRGAGFLERGDAVRAKRTPSARGETGGPRARQRPAMRLGLSPRKRTLLVMGGSQGARFINRIIARALPLLERESSWLQILHSTGEAGYEETLRAYDRSTIQAAVHRFIDDMASAYAVSDLTLCRAGGTTLAELTALGVPAVLVPLPIAANDHQRRNASLVAGKGAALLAAQEDLTPERLAAVLLKLLKDDACLTRMGCASLRLGRPRAARSVAGRLAAFVMERRQDAGAGRVRARKFEEVCHGAP